MFIMSLIVGLTISKPVGLVIGRTMLIKKKSLLGS